MAAILTTLQQEREPASGRDCPILSLRRHGRDTRILMAAVLTTLQQEREQANGCGEGRGLELPRWNAKERPPRSLARAALARLRCDLHHKGSSSTSGQPIGGVIQLFCLSGVTQNVSANW